MNVTGFNISETEVNISWSLIPEEYRHGIIIGYRVYYQDDHRHSGSITVPASQRNVLLNGLFSYTLYNISIAGITRAGEGWKKTSALVHTNPGGSFTTIEFIIKIPVYHPHFPHHYHHCTELPIIVPSI
jgi:hypothetical protein